MLFARLCLHGGINKFVCASWMMQQKDLVSDTSVHLCASPYFPSNFKKAWRKVKTVTESSRIRSLLREERAAGSSSVRVNMEEVLAPLREAVKEQVRCSDTCRNNYKLHIAQFCSTHRFFHWFFRFFHWFFHSNRENRLLESWFEMMSLGYEITHGSNGRFKWYHVSSINRMYMRMKQM